MPARVGYPTKFFLNSERPNSALVFPPKVGLVSRLLIRPLDCHSNSCTSKGVLEVQHSHHDSTAAIRRALCRGPKMADSLASPRYDAAMFRIIFSLWLDLGHLPDGTLIGLVVPLDRNGNGKHARPRHKRRVIDLRVGDEILCQGIWRRIEGISAHRDAWLTEADAMRRSDEGYVYRPRSGLRTNPEATID